jgi:hypothetical protein
VKYVCNNQNSLCGELDCVAEEASLPEINHSGTLATVLIVSDCVA